MVNRQGGPVAEIGLAVEMRHGARIEAQPAHQIGIHGLEIAALRRLVPHRAVTLIGLNRATGLTQLAIKTGAAIIESLGPPELDRPDMLVAQPGIIEGAALLRDIAELQSGTLRGAAARIDAAVRRDGVE